MDQESVNTERSEEMRVVVGRSCVSWGQIKNVDVTDIHIQIKFNEGTWSQPWNNYSDTHTQMKLAK